MKRLAGGLVGLALAGSVAVGGPFMSGVWSKNMGCSYGGCRSAPNVPDVIGPWGQPVPMAMPYAVKPPDGSAAAQAMLANSLPMDIVQATGLNQGMGMPGAVGPGTMISPPGVAAMPGMPAFPRGPAVSPQTNGIQRVNHPAGAGGPPGAVAAVNALTGGGAGAGHFQASRTEIRFVEPSGMKVSWYGPSANGPSGFATNFIEAPGRYNFVQAAIYRLKLSDIPNRPGLELYPTLEIVPANARTATFLAHAAVPVSFTEEDFQQVTAGNFVVKVIYLPDPRFQDLAAAGLGEIISSQLEPGVDPIAEACRRGSILTIVRIGNIDLEAPNTPAMDAPSPYMPKHAALPARPGMPMPGAPGAPGAGPMVPPSMLTGRPGMPPMPPNMPLPPGMPMMPGPGGMPQMMPNPGAMPVMPPNMLPPNMTPPPQRPPVGPVGQAPQQGVQQVSLTAAQLAAQEAGAAAPKPSTQRRGLFNWGSSDSSKK